jgi:hypothetical protein
VIQVLIESRTITEREIEIYRSSKFEVITVVPSHQNPTMNVYVFDQEELEQFLKTYSRYAEFVISVRQVEAMA